MVQETKVAMTTSEAGRKGGSAVRDKYGEDYYRRIGKLGGTALKDKRGNDYYRSIAKKGGRANVDKYGPDHFSYIGIKGGNATKTSQPQIFIVGLARWAAQPSAARKLCSQAEANWHSGTAPGRISVHCSHHYHTVFGKVYLSGCPFGHIDRNW